MMHMVYALTIIAVVPISGIIQQRFISHRHILTSLTGTRLLKHTADHLVVHIVINVQARYIRAFLI